MKVSGFSEVAHTADWELRAWSGDMAGLLTQAAQGMYALSGVRLAARGRRARRILALQAAEPERLLVRFLNELLHYAEQERLAFDRFDLQVSGDSAVGGLDLQASLSGRRITAQEKEIKAVTYHNLLIRQTESGLTANVVFDV